MEEPLFDRKANRAEGYRWSSGRKRLPVEGDEPRGSVISQLLSDFLLFWHTDYERAAAWSNWKTGANPVNLEKSLSDWRNRQSGKAKARSASALYRQAELEREIHRRRKQFGYRW